MPKKKKNNNDIFDMDNIIMDTSRVRENKNDREIILDNEIEKTKQREIDDERIHLERRNMLDFNDNKTVKKKQTQKPVQKPKQTKPKPSSVASESLSADMPQTALHDKEHLEKMMLKKKININPKDNSNKQPRTNNINHSRDENKQTGKIDHNLHKRSSEALNERNREHIKQTEKKIEAVKEMEKKEIDKPEEKKEVKRLLSTEEMKHKKEIDEIQYLIRQTNKKKVHPSVRHEEDTSEVSPESLISDISMTRRSTNSVPHAKYNEEFRDVEDKTRMNLAMEYRREKAEQEKAKEEAHDFDEEIIVDIEDDKPENKIKKPVHHPNTHQHAPSPKPSTQIPTRHLNLPQGNKTLDKNKVFEDEIDKGMPAFEKELKPLSNRAKYEDPEDAYMKKYEQEFSSKSSIPNWVVILLVIAVVAAVVGVVALALIK